jgi:hypothetical protein
MTAPEVVVPTEESEPGEDSLEAFSVTDEDVLQFVRDAATQRDPKNARFYATASPGRIKDGIGTLATILSAHLAFHQRTGRGAKTGRRKHAAAIRAAVLATNEVTYTLGLAWLDLGYGLLPAAEPPDD